MGGGILMVDGILYMSAPDNAWAVDARDGTVLWHYYWKTRGGTHTGNRGMGMWHDNLYLEVHDDYLICLDAKTGHEKWKKEISSFDQQYFSSVAPIVVGNHILAGTGNDMDAPGFLQSFDPETGERQWIAYTVPMKAGDKGLDTWASLDAAQHGGGQAWIPGAYDPETHLYIFGTGNPTPAYTTGRGEGDNLYTCSHRRGECGHRENRLGLPNLAARHARLGCHGDAHSDRRAVQRTDAQDGVDRPAQRLLLHSRSRDRRAPGHRQDGSGE